MSKRLAVIIFLSSIYLWVLTSQGFCQTETTDGLQWLTSVQQADGYWGEWNMPIMRNTTAAAEAYQVLDQTPPSYASALQWLSTAGSVNNDYVSRRMTVFSRTNNDISADLNYLLSARKPDCGWGLDSENESGILNTALALQALRAVNYTDYSVLFGAVNFLTTNQNSDGGWGFNKGDSSNAYVTAIVLRTLASYNNITFNVQTNINNASAYLLAKQNPDGGFGSSPSTIYETALSIISLIESGQGSTQAL